MSLKLPFMIKMLIKLPYKIITLPLPPIVIYHYNLLTTQCSAVLQQANRPSNQIPSRPIQLNHHQHRPKCHTKTPINQKCPGVIHSNPSTWKRPDSDRHAPSATPSIDPAAPCSPLQAGARVNRTDNSPQVQLRVASSPLAATSSAPPPR